MTTTTNSMTIHALSRKYAMHSRTVERRLAGIEPASIERRGQIVIRLYREADVRERLLAKSDAEQIREAYEELHGLRADILEIKRTVRRRENIPVDLYQGEIAARISNAKQRLIGLPAKLADQLAGATATRQATLIQQELDEIEEDLAEPFSWEKKH